MLNKKQKERLVSLLGLFVTTARGQHIGSATGDMQTVREYADETLRMFGIPAEEARFVLTPAEEKAREERRQAAFREERRAIAYRRKHGVWPTDREATHG